MTHSRHRRRRTLILHPVFQQLLYSSLFLLSPLVPSAPSVFTQIYLIPNSRRRWGYFFSVACTGRPLIVISEIYLIVATSRMFSRRTDNGLWPYLVSLHLVIARFLAQVLLNHSLTEIHNPCNKIACKKKTTILRYLIFSEINSVIVS